MPKSDILCRSVATGETASVVCPDWVVFSSSNCPWRDSLKVEHHRRPPHERMEIVLPETNVHFYNSRMKQPFLMEWRLAGSSLKRKYIQPGEIGIMAKDTPVSGRCFSSTDLLIVSFSSHLLNAAGFDSAPGARMEVQRLLQTRDHTIPTIGLLLDMQVRARCPTRRTH